jgi:hypothetical protein
VIAPLIKSTCSCERITHGGVLFLLTRSVEHVNIIRDLFLYEVAIMELKAHVQMLVDLNPLYIKPEMGQGLTLLLETAIDQSQTLKKHEFLVDLLNVTCLMSFIFHGRSALLPLRALVGHVLAECPKAKDLFVQALTESCSELRNALL